LDEHEKFEPLSHKIYFEIVLPQIFSRLKTLAEVKITHSRMYSGANIGFEALLDTLTQNNQNLQKLIIGIPSLTVHDPKTLKPPKQPSLSYFNFAGYTIHSSCVGLILSNMDKTKRCKASFSRLAIYSVSELEELFNSLIKASFGQISCEIEITCHIPKPLNLFRAVSSLIKAINPCDLSLIIYNRETFKESKELQNLYDLLRTTKKVTNVMIETLYEGMYYGERFKGMEAAWRKRE